MGSVEVELVCAVGGPSALGSWLVLCVEDACKVMGCCVFADEEGVVVGREGHGAGPVPERVSVELCGSCSGDAVVAVDVAALGVTVGRVAINDRVCEFVVELRVVSVLYACACGCELVADADDALACPVRGVLAVCSIACIECPCCGCKVDAAVRELVADVTLESLVVADLDVVPLLERDAGRGHPLL